MDIVIPQYLLAYSKLKSSINLNVKLKTTIILTLNVQILFIIS